MAIAVVKGDMNVSSLGPFSTAQQLSSALNRNELSAEHSRCRRLACDFKNDS